MAATNGPQIRQHRVRLKIKPGAFAAEMGISRGHLHGIEAGTRRPSDELLQTLADRFGVEVSTLVVQDDAAVSETAA